MQLYNIALYFIYKRIVTRNNIALTHVVISVPIQVQQGDGSEERESHKELPEFRS